MGTTTDVTSATATQRAAVLVERYLDLLRDHEPVTWTLLGGSDRDEELPEVAPDAHAGQLRALAALEGEVASARGRIGAGTTGPAREASDDLALLADELEHRRHRLEATADGAAGPLETLEVVAAAVHELLRRDDLEREERLRRCRAAVARAREVPRFLEQAGRGLEAVPEPHLAVALGRIPALLVLFSDLLPSRVAGFGGDAAAAAAAGSEAAAGLEAYAALLEELDTEVHAPWRAGPRHHEVVLRAGLGASMSATRIHQRAADAMALARQELSELARASWPQRFPGEALPSDEDERIRRAFAAIARTSVPAAASVGELQRAVAEVRAFAADLGCGDLPPASRLAVALAPDHLGPTAAAFVTAPPPLGPTTGCVLHLAAVAAGTAEARVAAFRREQSPAHLRSLALHEAYPGHVVQIEHAARHPRLARRVLRRAVFAEGWAVHAERVAMAAGFGDGATSAVDRSDLRFVHQLHELRLAAAAVLDVGLHAGDLDDQAATGLLAGAFHAPDAIGDLLTRAKVSPGQLTTYFVGGAELGDLRSEVRARAGGRGFDERRFHQQLLSHGTPTVDVLRRAIADGEPPRRPFA